MSVSEGAEPAMAGSAGDISLPAGITLLLGDVRAKLAEIDSDSVDCCVTSPPYWGLRDYGVDGQIGLERTLGEHLAVMVEVFREVRRVLKPSGTCWVNYGDCYASTPNGRSAAAVKAAGNDDRTFRDKPFSTVGPIYAPISEDRQKARGAKNSGFENRSAPPVPGIIHAAGYLKAKDLCMVPQRLFIALQEDGWWVRSVLPWIKRNGMPESIGDRMSLSSPNRPGISMMPRPSVASRVQIPMPAWRRISPPRLAACGQTAAPKPMAP
jgi:DNA modification methylase